MSTSKRIFYAIISISIGSAFILETTEIGFQPGMLLLTVVCIVCTLYENTWIIDTDTKTVTYRTGLIFLSYSKKWKLDEVESVRAVRFERGFKKTQWIRLSLEFIDGTIRIIETAPEKKIAPLIGKAEKLGDLFIQN